MSADAYRDHGRAQDAYERLLPQIDELANTGRHDEAIQILDRLLERYQHLDADGWLRRSVLSHRALLLLDAGRVEEALAAYDERDRLGSHDPSERCEQALGRGACLSRLGRQEEAIEVLESALAGLPQSHVGSALGLLYRLAEVYAAVGRPMPSRYIPLLKASAEAHGIVISAEPAELAEAVMAVHRAVVEREAGTR